MSAIAKPRFELHASRRPAPGRSVLLHNVSWKTYKTICDTLEERHEYLTYDNGVLEIMVVSGEHERYKSLFPYIILVLAQFFGKKSACFGSFTHQRDDLEKGMEPDQCFYLASLSAVKGKKNVDLMRDPPPDLAVEINIKSSSLNRLGIYAALEVPEVWHSDGKILRVLTLFKGRYEVRDESPTFPGFAIQKLVRFLELGIAEHESVMMEALKKWLSRRSRRKKPG